MQALKTYRSVSTSTLAVALMFVTACQPDPTGVTSTDLGLAEARNIAPSYTGTNLGALFGDNSSRANGVNDAGEVVGYSCCSLGSRAFVTLSGALTALAGDHGNALAISNGSTRYVVGWAGGNSQPVRWTIAAGSATPSQPTSLDIGAAAYGAARGVNDAGEAVGNAGANAAMWDAAGILTIVPAPAGFVSGEGRGIDNEGHAVFVFFRPDPAWPDGIAIGYLRLASGMMIQLPPGPATGISYANALTTVTGNNVGVAGSTYATPSTPRAVRWTVDIVQGQIMTTEVRSETSHAVGISNGGATAGFTEGQSHSLASSAFRWKGTQLVSLSPPQRGKEGTAWAISPSGVYVAGEALIQSSRTAVLWKIF
jgi:hypothetical protein